MAAIAKFTFLNYLFWFFVGTLVRFTELINLWRPAADWDRRISRACFRVSSAACPALMALERVRSDSLKSLSRKALSFVPQTIISLMRESQRFSYSHSALNFFSSVIKSWKLWLWSCLYVKNLWRGMVIFFLELQYSENLFKTGSNFISSSARRFLYLFGQ